MHDADEARDEPVMGWSSYILNSVLQGEQIKASD
jgi:hypothetical protein